MNELISVNQLHEHMNLSYRKIDEPISHKNLERSLLNGTHINSHIVEYCNLRLSEWTGANIEGVTFLSSDFKYSEIKSTHFFKTVFKEIIFDDTIISDSTFSNCVFIDCNLVGTFFQENTFNNCVFESVNFTEASAFLNQFVECAFKKTYICGSFYYSIFKDCELDDCVIDQYLLGYILGLLGSKMNNITYLKGNEIFNDNFERLIHITFQDYEKRMKFVNHAILQLNLNSENNIDYCLFACINAFVLCSENEITISSDDVKFVRLIIEDSYSRNLISPCMIFEAGLLIQKELQNVNVKSEINKKQLKNLYNCLYFCQQDFLLKNTSKVKVGKQEVYTLFLKYDKKPRIELVNILKYLTPNRTHEPTVIKTECGSFLEWIQCDGNAITMLALLLDFLGIAIPMTYEVIKGKRNKKKEKEKTQQTGITNININQLQIVINNNNIENMSNVLNTVNTCNFSVSNEFMGYNNYNVREITILK